MPNNAAITNSFIKAWSDLDLDAVMDHFTRRLPTLISPWAHPM